jgi:16S rRNA (cytosine1402-N4)-methyltransferase
VDGTVGGGGHAAALLRASAPDGTLLGCDRDGAAVEAAGARLAEFAGRFDIRRGSFAGLDQWIEAGSCDGVVLDLGVSSPQLDWPERGFSFLSDGPLDMRMDLEQELTAAALLRQTGADELAKIFWEYGGEVNSRRIARAIERERETRPLLRTRQLAELIEKVSPRGGIRRPAVAGLRSGEARRAGVAAAPGGDFAVGAAESDCARRGGIEREPAQLQRAMPGDGKIIAAACERRDSNEENKRISGIGDWGLRI